VVGLEPTGLYGAARRLEPGSKGEPSGAMLSSDTNTEVNNSW
jgi:hypothetical protein